MFPKTYPRLLVFFQSLVFKLLVFLIPSQLGKHFWPSWAYVFGIRVDFLSPTIYFTDVLILVLLVLWFLELTSSSDFDQKIISIRRFFKDEGFIVFGVAVFVMTNIYFAVNPFVALVGWLKISKLFFFCLFIVYSKNLIIKDWVIKPIVLSVVFFGLLGLAQFVRQKTLGGLFYFVGEREFSSETPGIAKTTLFGREILRAYSTFPHPNALAGFMAGVLFLVAFLPKKILLKNKKKTPSMAFYIFGLLMIMLSFSRSVWMAAILLLLIVLVKVKARFFLKKTLVFLPLIVIMFSLASLFFLTRANLKPFFNNQAIEQRLEYAATASRIFLKRPLTGSGLGNFILARNIGNGGESYFGGLEPVHNIFLLVLAETGIIGLVFFYLFLTVTLKKSLVRDNWFLIFPLLLILLTGMTDHYWLTLQQNLLTFSLFTSLAFKKG